VNTETGKRRNGRIFLLPVLMALPVATALTVLMIRFGPTIRKVIGIMIKLAVTE
jgi:hypothetical protein